MRPFGKSIIRIIFSGAVFFVLDRFADVQTAIDVVRFTYAYPFLSCISIIFGPIVAGCSGILGLLFSFLLKQTGFQWIDLVCIFLFCLFIGIFSMSGMDIKDGILGRNDLDVYLRTQIIANVFVWFILRPLLYHYVLNAGLLNSLDEGLLLALNRSLSGMLIGSLLLDIFVRANYSEACFYRS